MLLVGLVRLAEIILCIPEYSKPRFWPLIAVPWLSIRHADCHGSLLQYHPEAL